jgi:hypothetical protein
MGCFVLAVMVFVMILYLVYMLSLPDDFKDGLDQLYLFLAIFDWIVGAIVLCMLFMFVKKIKEIHIDYGKIVMFEAVTFAGAMAGSGCFCYYLGSGGIK